MVLDPADNLYDWRLLQAHPTGPFRTTTHGRAVKIGDTFYDINPSRAWPIYGWYPALRRSFWADIWHATARGDTALLLFESGNPEALDRISGQSADPKATVVVTPEIQRTLDAEVLLKRHQTRMPFGSGASTKALLIVLIIIGALLAILFLGGSYG